jgi:hypothetical protein
MTGTLALRNWDDGAVGVLRLKRLPVSPVAGNARPRRAIALATIGTLMNDRLHFHWNRLIEDINPARPALQHFLDMHSGRLDALLPGDAAAPRSSC